MPSLTQLASGTPTGQKWLAFMRLEGIVPTPAGVTVDHLDDALDGCDLQAMRAAVQRETTNLRARFHVERTENR